MRRSCSSISSVGRALGSRRPSSCDPAYPDFCIPPARYPGDDLDCADIAPHHDFRVRQPRDPYGFDGNDDDGWGCES
jgi:hypothetical protein